MITIFGIWPTFGCLGQMIKDIKTMDNMAYIRVSRSDGKRYKTMDKPWSNWSISPKVS